MIQQRSGKKQGNSLIRNLKPILNEGTYVFCSCRDLEQVKSTDITGFFREKEGLTVILRKELADQLQMPYYYTAAWITLHVHSDLTTIGLSAAVSRVLADNNITCNMMAGYHHDHVFVGHVNADRALQLLRRMPDP